MRQSLYAATCNAVAEGTLRWDSTGKTFSYCNGTSWTNFNGIPAGASTQIQFNNAGAFGGNANFVWDNTNSRVGIGTATPAAPLDVNGAVKLGTSAQTCGATLAGGLRWDGGSSCVEFCNGTSWICLVPTTCADTTPTAFSFTDLASQTISTLVTSNILQISGFGCIIGTSISGGGSPQYRICSDTACSTVIQDWTGGTSSINSGEYLQLRLTTSGSGGDTRAATVIAGNTADVWSASTSGDCASSPPVGTVCADGTVYAGLSPDGNVPMFVTRCDAGMSWNGTTCTGARWTLTWNNGTANWTNTGATNTATGEANTNTLAASADAGADYAAAEHCFGFDDGQGNIDWYLPARQELAVMESGKSAIGQFDQSGNYYWSSSEFDSRYAYIQRFSDGYQTTSSKEYTSAVRCARR